VQTGEPLVYQLISRACRLWTVDIGADQLLLFHFNSMAQEYVATAAPALCGSLSQREARRSFRIRNLLETPWMCALRPHQSAKNVLVFVPMIAAHQSNQLHLWSTCA
jgi:hypothetical protein